jgi:hypothetical protein
MTRQQTLAVGIAVQMHAIVPVRATPLLVILNSFDEDALEYLHDLLPRLDDRQQRLLAQSIKYLDTSPKNVGKTQRRVEIASVATEMLSPSRWLWTDSDVDGVAKALETADWKDAPLRSTLSNEVCAGMLMEFSALGKLNEWSGRKWKWLAAHVAELEPLRGKFSDHGSIEPDFCEQVIAGSPALREGFL